jgi:alkylation response protein AidB-like acyl-CoA dehydrogenase
MHQLANLKAQYTAVRLQALAAAWKMDQGKPVGVDAAMAKLQVSELYKSATSILSTSFEGLNRPNRDAALSHMDALSSTIYSGTSEMQRTIISQAL